MMMIKSRHTEKNKRKYSVSPKKFRNHFDGVFGNQTALRLQEMVARELHEKAKVRTRLTNLTANIDKDQKKSSGKKKLQKRKDTSNNNDRAKKSLFKELVILVSVKIKQSFQNMLKKFEKGLKYWDTMFLMFPFKI